MEENFLLKLKETTLKKLLLNIKDVTNLYQYSRCEEYYKKIIKFLLSLDITKISVETALDGVLIKFSARNEEIQGSYTIGAQGDNEIFCQALVYVVCDVEGRRLTRNYRYVNENRVTLDDINKQIGVIILGKIKETIIMEKKKFTDIVIGETMTKEVVDYFEGMDYFKSVCLGEVPVISFPFELVLGRDNTEKLFFDEKDQAHLQAYLFDEKSVTDLIYLTVETITGNYNPVLKNLLNLLSGNCYTVKEDDFKDLIKAYNEHWGNYQHLKKIIEEFKDYYNKLINLLLDANLRYIKKTHLFKDSHFIDCRTIVIKGLAVYTVMKDWIERVITNTVDESELMSIVNDAEKELDLIFKRREEKYSRSLELSDVFEILKTSTINSSMFNKYFKDMFFSATDFYYHMKNYDDSEPIFGISFVDGSGENIESKLNIKAEIETPGHTKRPHTINLSQMEDEKRSKLLALTSEIYRSNLMRSILLKNNQCQIKELFKKEIGIYSIKSLIDIFELIEGSIVQFDQEGNRTEDYVALRDKFRDIFDIVEHELKSFVHEDDNIRFTIEYVIDPFIKKALSNPLNIW